MKSLRNFFLNPTTRCGRIFRRFFICKILDTKHHSVSMSFSRSQAVFHCKFALSLFPNSCVTITWWNHFPRKHNAFVKMKYHFLRGKRIVLNWIKAAARSFKVTWCLMDSITPRLNSRQEKIFSDRVKGANYQPEWGTENNEITVGTAEIKTNAI